MKNKIVKLFICALSLALLLSFTACSDSIGTQLVPEPTAYTITVSNGNGGGIYNSGSTVTLTPDTADDERFDGWYEGTTLLSADEEYSFTAEKDVTIAASYSAKYAAITITGGGYDEASGSSSFNAVRGEEYTIVAKEDQNKDFVKFIVDGTDVTTNPYVFTADEDLTISTVYENTYMIYAESGKVGTADTNTAVLANDGDKVTITYVAEEGAMTFMGWYDINDNLVSESQTFTLTVSKTTYLYAKIGADVTIEFGYYNPDTAEYVVVLEKVYTEGQNVVAPTSPEVTGYDFVGWFTASEGGTEVTDFGTATADTQYYAQFESAKTQLVLPSFDLDELVWFQDDGTAKIMTFSDGTNLFTGSNVVSVRILVYTSATADADDYVATITYTLVDGYASLGNVKDNYVTAVYEGVGENAGASSTATQNWVNSGINVYASGSSLKTTLNTVSGSTNSAYYFAVQLVADNILYVDSEISGICSTAITG